MARGRFGVRGHSFPGTRRLVDSGQGLFGRLQVGRAQSVRSCSKGLCPRKGYCSRSTTEPLKGRELSLNQ